MVQVASAAVDEMGPMFVPLPMELEALLASGGYVPPKTCRGLAHDISLIPPMVPPPPPPAGDSTPKSLPIMMCPPPGLTPLDEPETLKSDEDTTSALDADAQPYTPLSAGRNSSKMSSTSSKQESRRSAQEVAMSVVGEVLGQDAWKAAPHAHNQDSSRWWTRSLVLCPLTGFPISHLPYPPFKLRVDPKKPRPHTLVDGKFLAMQVIVDKDFVACDRTLQASDIAALDEYIHRCKLGPFRPGQALAYAKEAETAESTEGRTQAAQDFKRFVAAANTELSKLRRIQENRLRQMNGKAAGGMQQQEQQQQHQQRRSSTHPASNSATAAGGHKSGKDGDASHRRRVRTI